MVSKSVRRSLLATTIIAGALSTSPALAQTAPEAPAAAEETGTIVVTGTLIKNPNLSQSSPVIVTSAEEIALRQNNVAEEVLRDIPGIVPSTGSAVNNGNGGASFVNLRGLGSNRNIVLLDGNRIVPSGLVGRVDLNNIPLALVERVDALTGGASTTYGADAISGVVNFITKQNFSGVDISLGEKLTEKADGNYLRADVTIGANFADDRGNAVLSVGYQESDPVYQGDRDFSLRNVDSFSGTFGGSGTTVPSRVTGTRGLAGTTPSTTAAFTQTGLTTTAITLANGTILPVGTPILAPVTGGQANGGTRQIDPTTGQAVGTFALFNFNPYNIFQTPFIRYNMFASARYEVSDAVELYARGMFSKNNVKTIIAPSGSFGSSVTVNLNNPYLPASFRNQLCALNTAPTVSGVNLSGTTPASVAGQATYTPLITPAQCAAAATATGPSDPNYRTATFNLSRRLVEGGPRISDFSTTIFDYRLGARGALSESINWDLNASYGESENRQTLQGYVLTSRLRQALLANNTTTCITNTNGCVPLNAFGPQGSITAAQATFLQQGATTLVKTSLSQVRGVISGDFGTTIPMASDPVNFAVGAEYRKYGASQLADSLSKQAGELGGAGGAAPDIDGGYEVYEAFGELVLPLVQDKPGFEELQLSGGIRYSSYTVNAATKPKYNTTTYKGDLTWSPVKDIKLRGGYSRAVRAPNISELFTPVTTTLTSLSTDPCAGAAPTANANLRAVCIAQGAPAGTIGSIQNPTAGQANVTSGGNLNVKPETSDSFTLGVIFTPSFVPGLSLTVDYYKIKIRDAITTPTSGDVINGCFTNLTAASASNPDCIAVIRRNPVTGGLDGDPATTQGLITQLTNAGRISTDGIDVALNYRRDIGFAKLSLSATGNYTFSSKFQANPQSVNRECIGLYSANCGTPGGSAADVGSLQPKFQWSVRPTLSFGDIDVSLLWRHIDKMRYEDFGDLFVGNLPDGSGPYDFNKIRAYDYFDLSTRISVTKALEVTIGVNNLFDVKPPLIGSTAGTTGFNSGNTYPSTYDTLGRSYAVSARIRL